MAQASTVSRPTALPLRAAQLGDGGHLGSASSAAVPQPGDGAYLAFQNRQNNRSSGTRQPQSSSNNDGSANGARGGNRQPRGGPVRQHGTGSGPNLPHRPARTERAPASSSQSGSTSMPNNRRPNNDHQHRSRHGHEGGIPNQNMPNSNHEQPARLREDGLHQTLAAIKVPQLQQQGSLDPDAPSFTPGAALPTTDLDHSPDDSVSKAGTQGNSQRKKKNNNRTKDGKKKDVGNSKGGGDGVSDQKPAVVSSRRAAFQQTTKLTKTVSRSSVEGPAKTEDSKKQGKGGKKKLDEADDLVSRLTRGLKNRPLLECPICFNSITPSQSIWSCLPPDQPPQPSSSVTLLPNPITGSTSTSNHYSACYTPFHLDCIKDWANRSLEEEQNRAQGAGREGEEIAWRCPGCQKRRADRVAGYRCFCGRLSHPATSTSAPHSCNDSCARTRPKCSHPCPLPCHPGPCPPCQVALVVPCPSHHTPLTVKCSAATSNNAAMSPVCDESCSRQLNCGNREHNCEQLCHYGPCKPCDQKEVARCYCGADQKDVECGWGQKSEKVCARLNNDGEEESWWGKYDCERACESLFDCGIHPCKESCHPHPIHPLKCPNSPEVVTHCPCGTTPLSSLPGFPRPDCLAPVPTCTSQCPKNRPCGHTCPKKCHTGPCPPCHEEVVRTCRCGQSQLLVPCDELREKAENGQDEVTCERVCQALRNCGRHECGRRCCPLWEQVKLRNRKQRNEDQDLFVGDDLHKCHLICGKTLSCGLHGCPKPDHKGPCGRCLQASYDELICHCGHTIIYPPVACGTTINCPYPCARAPPACGHPKIPHSCHESTECPPCPYLTEKPCACGKDPSVKHIRCSQDRVSCGQPCGQLLGCGYHKCTKSCHKPGDCESCTQVCSKPKRICKHACTATCHAPAKCPENDPCQDIVTQTCACGHLQSRTSCGASLVNPRSREVEQLKCNSECAVRQRNARLADALGIKQNEKGTETYEDELKSFAGGNHGFVKMVEGKFEEFFKGPRQSMVLPHMPAAKRTFVMALAEHYRLARELIDQEPNRSVQIRRRVDTRIPSPLLSATVSPTPAAPTTRLVTSLGSGWGKTGGSGTAASVVAGSGSGLSSGLSGWGSGSAPSSNRPSRAATPVAPTLRETSLPGGLRTSSPKRQALSISRQAGRREDGDEVDDWDVDV